MALRSTSAGVTGTGTSAAVPVPTGAASDDIVVVFGFVRDNADAITPPAGFTQKAIQNNTAISRGQLIMWWKRLTGSDAGTHTFTWTNSAVYQFSSMAFSGRIRYGDPFSVTGTAINVSTTALSQAVSITTLTPGEDLVTGGSSHATNAGGWTAPSSMTETYDTIGVSNPYLNMNVQENIAAGVYSKTVTSVSGTTGSTYIKIISGGLMADRVSRTGESASGALGSPATPVTVTLPTHVTGGMILVAVSGKSETATAPTIDQGFTLIKSGTGGDAAGGFGMFMHVYAKVAASASETNPTITASGTTPNCWVWTAAAFDKGVGKAWLDTIGSNVNWVEIIQDTAKASTNLTGTSTAFTNQPTSLDGLHLFLGADDDTSNTLIVTLVTLSATGLSGGVPAGGTYTETSQGSDTAAQGYTWEGFTGPATSGVTFASNPTGFSNPSGVIAVVNLRQGTGTTNVTGTRATETDAAQAGTTQVGIVVAGTKATETDAARAGTVRLNVPGGRATEADTARAGTVDQVLHGGRAGEADAARAGTLDITVPGGRATETDTANAGAAVEATVVQGGRATETDVANAGSVTVGAVVTGTRATEADAARAGATHVGVIVTGTRATEADAARAGSVNVGVTVVGTRATEADSARVGTVSVAVQGGRATETDVANAGSVTDGSGDVLALGQAIETDTAQTLTLLAPGDITITLGQASETDTAFWITIPVPAGDLTLHIIDDELVDTPANMLVTVGNGNDGETIVFSLSGPSGYFSGLLTELVDDEDGTAELSIPLPELVAGTYVLTATGSISGSATDQVLVLEEALDDTEDEDDNAVPDAPTFTPDPAQHWQFIDTTVGAEETFTFPHNPSRWTNPNRPNFLEHDVTTAPDGNVLAWEGAERSWTFEASGYLDTPELYASLQHWSEKRRRFWLVDHRNRLHYVTIDNFDPRARIVPNKLWAHDYTLRFVHFYRADWDGSA